MSKRNFCKLIFVFSLLMSVLAIYDGVSLPENLQPVHPAWLSWSLTISDLFVLVATFCVAFKFTFLHITFWQLILLSYVFSALLAIYFEYSAGGYSQYEIIWHGFYSLLFLGIICFPVVYYFEDLKNKE